MGIEGGQLRRPERLPHVFRVTINSVSQTHGKRKSGVRSQGSAFSLTGHRNRRVGDRKREQRQFLQEQNRKSRLGEIVTGRRRTSAYSAQRPIIEEQKDEGQRHQHGLGGQAASEQSDHG